LGRGESLVALDGGLAFLDRAATGGVGINIRVRGLGLIVLLEFGEELRELALAVAICSPGRASLHATLFANELPVDLE
jgi:hypothetical protein